MAFTLTFITSHAPSSGSITPAARQALGTDSRISECPVRRLPKSGHLGLYRSRRETMMRWTLVVAAAALALFLTSSMSQAAEEKDAGLVGKPAPDIQGDFGLNGKPVTMKELKGKVVVLDFWAVWCGFCYDTIPHLVEMNKEYKGKGLEIIGLTSYYQTVGFNKDTGRGKRLDAKMSKEDEQAMLKELAAHHKMDYRIQAVDQAEMKSILKEYKITGFPTVIVIDRKGVVRLVKVGAGKANNEAVEKMVKELVAEKE